MATISSVVSSPDERLPRFRPSSTFSPTLLAHRLRHEWRAPSVTRGVDRRRATERRAPVRSRAGDAHATAALRRRRLPSAHRVRQPRRPAARPERSAPPRDGRARVARCHARAAATSALDREPASLCRWCRGGAARGRLGRQAHRDALLLSLRALRGRLRLARAGFHAGYRPRERDRVRHRACARFEPRGAVWVVAGRGRETNDRALVFAYGIPHRTGRTLGGAARGCPGHGSKPGEPRRSSGICAGRDRALPSASQPCEIRRKSRGRLLRRAHATVGASSRRARRGLRELPTGSRVGCHELRRGP